MKKVIALALVALMSLLISGCGNSSLEQQVKGKTFIYEKDGFGGDFYITLNTDRTFQFYEGPLSSHFSDKAGTWEVNGKDLTLTHYTIENNNHKNNFRIKNDSLVFQEKNSDNFFYIKVVDGEKFIMKD